MKTIVLNNVRRIDSDHNIATVSLRFNSATNEMVPESSEMAVRPKGQPFLKGPIQISWLEKAARLPGKSLNVALAIHWLSGM